MKMQYQIVLSLILFALPFTIAAQGNTNGQGGDFTQQHLCLPESQRDEIKQQLAENIRLLGLDETNTGRAVDDLKFPLRAAAAIPGYFNYWSVSGYVDHNASSGIQDYNCQNQTYDGHRGSDYFTFPFSFYLYNNDLVEVIASAPGTIISKQDGNSDVNCSPSGSWNAVYVRHADGSVMWYGHLKDGSLTSKNIGATVEEGEYLGILASSGYSSGPHLHIEYYHENGNLLDPYQGNCNDLNNNSMWDVQPLHINPKVNAVLTHSFIPNLDCGLNVESVNFVNEFYAGDRTVVAIYMTDYVAAMVANTRILRPDGSQFDAFNTFNTQNSYDWFWNSRSYWLDQDDPEGEWTVECTFNGLTYT
ncbi:MAG: M23 family metallopeptidase, partial [Bacteroidota bacterium]